MQKEFVTYELSNDLKELGFNEPCLAIYSGESFRLNSVIPIRKNSELNFFEDIKTQVAAPLWQQAIDWFREVHRLDVTIKFPEPKNGRMHEGLNTSYYDIEIKHLSGGDVWNKYKFSQYSDDYYVIREKAIECAIEEVKTMVKRINNIRNN